MGAVEGKERSQRVRVFFELKNHDSPLEPAVDGDFIDGFDKQLGAAALLILRS